MGISDFLTRVLETVGRPCDLRDYKLHGISVFDDTGMGTLSDVDDDEDEQGGDEDEDDNDNDHGNDNQQGLQSQPQPQPQDHTIDEQHQGRNRQHPQTNQPSKRKRSRPSKREEPQRQRRRRPLRIAVDVSTWIQTAAYGYGDMLGDERHLTNYGRSTLLHEQQQQQQQDGQQPSSSTTGFNPSEDVVREYVDICTKFVISRLEFLKESTNADILVVLDGNESPPMKQREIERRRGVRRQQEQIRELPVNPNISPHTTNLLRTKAFKRAGAGRYYSQIIYAIIVALRQIQLFPFCIAPYEADAQLAFLSKRRFVDLIITEDSDLIAHGVPTILYKSIQELGGTSSLKSNNNNNNNNHPHPQRPCGILFQYSDLGAATSSSGMGGGGMDTFPQILMDFSPVMMAILFVSVGCDYCEKLKGIGILTASRIIRNVFFHTSSSSSSDGASNNNQNTIHTTSRSKLSASTPTSWSSSSHRRHRIKQEQDQHHEQQQRHHHDQDHYHIPRTKSKLTQILNELYSNSYLDSKTLTPQFKFEYEDKFLSALFMYRHPIIYNPLLEQEELYYNRNTQSNTSPTTHTSTSSSRRNHYEPIVKQTSSEEEEVESSSSSEEDDNDDDDDIHHPNLVMIDPELMDHDAYVELCGDMNRIQDIVGTLRPKHLAMKHAQGLLVVTTEDTNYLTSSKLTTESGTTMVSSSSSSLPLEDKEDESENDDDDDEMEETTSQIDEESQGGLLGSQEENVSNHNNWNREPTKKASSQRSMDHLEKNQNQSPQCDAVMETLQRRTRISNIELEAGDDDDDNNADDRILRTQLFLSSQPS